ncbi:MAG: hypothetical protein Q8J78_13350 [Moraxellaceae bacterium]|nr:hypothetical protein [Moraxellaceae bacterium]
MNQMARMPTAAVSSVATSADAFASRCDKTPDHVGMWYEARRRFDIDDRMWFGFYERGESAPEWKTLSHRHGDGIGGLSVLLKARGHDVGPLPAGRPMPVPGWKELWRTRRKVEAPVPSINWKTLDAAAARSHSHVPVSLLLTSEQTRAIEAAAVTAGVSSTVWLLWTADRAVRSTLAGADSVMDWVFPVNMRGSVACADPYMNHSSGFPVHIASGLLPLQVKQQIAARFARHEQWRSWMLLTLGRWIGQRGVNLLYRLVQAPPGRHTGSYSNMGEWNVPGLDGLTCSAPGSPAYPVAVSTMLCNGRRSLACRLHPVVGGSSVRAIEFLTLWRELSCTADSLSGW